MTSQEINISIAHEYMHNTVAWLQTHTARINSVAQQEYISLLSKLIEWHGNTQKHTSFRCVQKSQPSIKDQEETDRDNYLC